MTHSSHSDAAAPATGIVLYGIASCDTVKKARRWLDGCGVPHDFHDFRKAAPDAAQLALWLTALGRDALINRRGTTWRQLDAAARERASTDAGALALLAAHPSLIKRPLVRWADGRISVGFDAEAWAQWCATAPNGAGACAGASAQSTP